MPYPSFPEVSGIDGNGFDFEARAAAAQFKSGIQIFAPFVGNVNAIKGQFKYDRVFTFAELTAVTDFLNERKGWKPFAFQYLADRPTVICTCPGGYSVVPLGGDNWRLTATFMQVFRGVG